MNTKAMGLRLENVASAMVSRPWPERLPDDTDVLRCGSATLHRIRFYAMGVDALETFSPVPYLASQARARHQARTRTATLREFQPRGSADLLIEILSYLPHQELPDDLCEFAWELLDSTDQPLEQPHYTQHHLVLAGRRRLTRWLLGNDLGTQRRERAHHPEIVERDSRAMWHRAATSNFAEAIDEHLPDAIDYPYIWPNRAIPGQLRTTADKKAADQRRWIPPHEHVPKNAKSVPEPSDPSP